MDTNTHYVGLINPSLIYNIQSYKAYKYRECSVMLQNFEVPDTTYYISYGILFTIRAKYRSLLRNKTHPPICFHLSFVQRQSPQKIHKQKSDKKPIRDTQLISSQKNVIQVDG